MNRTDRAVRRASHHLAPGEALIASALGLEVDGRRRQVVLLTDRRVLLVGLRGEPPLELLREGCAAEYDTLGGLLAVRQGDRRLEVRDIKADAAARVITLLRRHRSTLTGRDPSVLRRVRVVQG